MQIWYIIGIKHFVDPPSYLLVLEDNTWQWEDDFSFATKFDLESAKSKLKEVSNDIVEKGYNDENEAAIFELKSAELKEIVE